MRDTVIRFNAEMKTIEIEYKDLLATTCLTKSQRKLKVIELMKIDFIWDVSVNGDGICCHAGTVPVILSFLVSMHDRARK